MTPLDEKIRRFTTRPAGADANPCPPRETLVVADPEDSLDDAFRLAKARLDLGDTVRLIAPGVTLRRAWPSWASETPTLTLTEWGAFRRLSHADATRALRGELRGWIDEVFDGDFGGFAPNRVLFEAARLRFLEGSLAVYPVAQEIARAFPGASVYCVNTHSPVAEALRHCVAATEGRVAGHDPFPVRGWTLRILGMGLLGEAIAIGRSLGAYVRGRATLSAIHERRSRHSHLAPTAWVGLMPDWPRINYHLIDAFALPATDNNEPLGVLFVGSLEPSRRDEADMRRHYDSDLWPGLGDLRERLPQCVIEQTVMPEHPLELARSLTTGVLRSARALSRLANAPCISVRSLKLNPRAADLVKWATIDVLRATLAEGATKAFLKRRQMAGKTVVFVAGNVAWAPTDLALQEARATTVEHDHGAHVDSGATVIDTESSLRLVWTARDARLSTLQAERVVVAGMPIRMRFRPRERHARNVLILTNYVHRDLVAGQRRAQRIFQSEILDIPRLLIAHGYDSLTFRWRPHPADVDLEVRSELEGHPELELSRQRTLEEDAEWCDVIASTTSTTVVESMFAGVPVFVQMLPDTWRQFDMGGLASERVFYDAQHGATLISEWLTRYASHASDGLEPERLARVAFFGESAEPVPMTERLAEARLRRAAGSDDVQAGA